MTVKRISSLLCSVIAVILVLAYFVNIPAIKGWDKLLNSWGVTISGFALGVGAINIVRLHTGRLARKDREWFYSSVCLGVFLFMSVLGIARGTGNSLYMFMFASIMESAQASVASLTIFYLATSAFRAFRIRNLDASLMLGAGVIAIIGGAPIGTVIWKGFPIASGWIMSVVNMAGQRGITIAAGLGAIAAALRIILGLERAPFTKGS